MFEKLKEIIDRIIKLANQCEKRGPINPLVTEKVKAKKSKTKKGSKKPKKKKKK